MARLAAALFLVVTGASACGGGCLAPSRVLCVEAADCPLGSCCNGSEHRCEAADAAFSTPAFCAAVVDGRDAGVVDASVVVERAQFSLGALGHACTSDEQCATGTACVESVKPGVRMCAVPVHACDGGCVDGTVCTDLTRGSACVTQCHPGDDGNRCGQGTGCRLLLQRYAACLPLALSECSDDSGCPAGDLCRVVGSPEQRRCTTTCDGGCAEGLVCRESAAGNFCAPGTHALDTDLAPCADDSQCDSAEDCVGESPSTRMCAERCSGEERCSRGSAVACVSSDGGVISIDGGATGAGHCFRNCEYLADSQRGCINEPTPATCVLIRNQGRFNRTAVCLPSSGTLSEGAACASRLECEPGLVCIAAEPDAGSCRAPCEQDAQCRYEEFSGICIGAIDAIPGYCRY